MKLYHGTSETVGRKALVEGLQPRGARKSQWEMASANDRVYLTTAYALFFASHACRNNDERWAVVEVDTDKLWEGNLVPDEDFLEQATRTIDGGCPARCKTMKSRTRWYRDHVEEYQPHWGKSLEGLGNCAHLGAIRPEAITRVAFFDSEKNMSMAMRAGDPTITLLNYRLVGDTYRALTRWLFDATTTADDLWGGLSPLPDQFRKGLEEIAANREGIEIKCA